MSPFRQKSGADSLSFVMPLTLRGVARPLQFLLHLNACRVEEQVHGDGS